MTAPPHEGERETGDEGNRDGDGKRPHERIDSRRPGDEQDFPAEARHDERDDFVVTALSVDHLTGDLGANRLRRRRPRRRDALAGTCRAGNTPADLLDPFLL